MYTLKRHEAHIPVSEYVKKYVDVSTFVECCKKCPNYGKVWSCPPYDFNVLDYWDRYSELEVIAEEILLDDEYAGQKFDENETKEILKNSLGMVKAALSEELYMREEEMPGSMSLSAGSCTLCDEGCTREDGEECRNPDKVRYSVESIGGNVSATIGELMGVEIEWASDGALPQKFVLVCGLLKK